MEGSSECEFLSAQSVVATVSASASSSTQYESAQDESMVESESLSSSMVQERIDASKSHWSELSDSDRSLSGVEVAADNRKVFRMLQSHPEWGHIFRTFDENSLGTLVVGEKFAEGGQAELFKAYVTWNDPAQRQYYLENKVKFALKVFKEGTWLRDLQGQWPHGFLRWKNDEYKRARNQLPLSPIRYYRSGLACGTILEDGRFAFLMRMEDEDLQSLIQRRMHGQKYGCRPLSKNESEIFMYKIGLGVLWLHEHDVVHRDLKAANVLFNKNGGCYVADYECSIGVIGTGYWRAPEILEACTYKTVSWKPELFSKAADVYSYGMIWYELLSGKSPFEGEMVTMESVIEGQRPILPTYVDDWTQQLLHKCWDSNPSERPSIQEILSVIALNTSMQWIKDVEEVRMRTRVTDVEELQLGCDNLLHTATRLKSGNFKCLLCFETCNDSYMMKCTTCTDHYLHSRCAIVEQYCNSSSHVHQLSMERPGWRGSSRLVCDGCQLEIGKEFWYQCPVAECDFGLHPKCAKYVGRILHPSHKEHKLVLSLSSSSTSLKDSSVTCVFCKLQITSMEFKYHCEECVFNIHPKCAVPNVKVHRC